MVWRPGTIHGVGVVIPQQFPVNPIQFTVLPDSKSALSHCAIMHCVKKPKTEMVKRKCLTSNSQGFRKKPKNTTNNVSSTLFFYKSNYLFT